MALVIAISLLAVMSLFGAMLLNNSTSEIQLSGNYSTSQDAFYVADGAANYALRLGATADNIDLYNDTIPGTTDTYLDAITVNPKVTLEPSTLLIDNDPATDDDDRNSIVYMREGSAPVNSGTEVNVSSSGTLGNYYTIRTVGLTPYDSSRPLSEQSPSRVDIRAMVWKGKQ